MNLKDYDEIPPPTSIVGAFRSYGYSFNTAISDLIDNSITAGSTKILIEMQWANGNPYVVVLDDGNGMTEEQLSANVVLGSKNPNEVRDKNDLGRFGLGLKTASFSLARELHIFSKVVNGVLSYRSWNLDVLEKENRWLVSKRIPGWYQELPERIQINEKGTLVLLKNCDRLLKNASTPQSLKELGAELIQYLGTIFSRYISSPANIKLFVHGELVPAWHPIPDGSKFLGDQFFQNIKIKPYLLPHRSKFANEDEYQHAAGIKGWVAQQGFYVYRNKRLIVNGGWLGLMKNEEHQRLARIVVDIDNSLDHLWQIDVMKSKASIPSGKIRNFLKGIAKSVRKQAEEVYRHRGKIVSREQVKAGTFVWQLKKMPHGKQSFIINEDHPLVKLVMENYSGRKGDVKKLLNLIAKCLPTEAIEIESSKDDGVSIMIII